MTFKEKWNLPEIIAVSEKQREYAEKVRENYFKLGYVLRMGEAQKVLASLRPDAVAKLVAKTGKTEREIIAGGMGNQNLYSEYMLLTTTDARELIDWIHAN